MKASEVSPPTPRSTWVSRCSACASRRVPRAADALPDRSISTTTSSSARARAGDRRALRPPRRPDGRQQPGGHGRPRRWLAMAGVAPGRRDHHHETDSGGRRTRRREQQRGRDPPRPGPALGAGPGPGRSPPPGPPAGGRRALLSRRRDGPRPGPRGRGVPATAAGPGARRRRGRRAPRFDRGRLPPPRRKFDTPGKQLYHLSLCIEGLGGRRGLLGPLQRPRERRPCGGPGACGRRSERIRGMLRGAGCSLAALSGSGSSFFGLFEDARRAGRAARSASRRRASGRSAAAHFPWSSIGSAGPGRWVRRRARVGRTR